MIPALLASVGLPLLVKAVGGALSGLDHPAAKIAVDALEGVGKAIGTKEIPPEQLAEANRHIERMAEIDSVEAREALAQINQTMRAESASDKWWVSGWRPFWGFVSALAFAIVAALVCWLGYQAVRTGNQDALRMVPDLVTAMAMLFGIPGAILGVASWHRGKEKRIRAGEAGRG